MSMPEAKPPPLPPKAPVPPFEKSTLRLVGRALVITLLLISVGWTLAHYATAYFLTAR